MGIIGSNIVFAMGTVGDKKTMASLMAAAAAVGAVIYKINQAREAAEKFARQWGALDTEQRKIVNSIGDVSKQLADTGIAMEIVTKQTEAMGKADKELSEAVVKLAIDVGQKLGESYDQIQQRILKLNDAVTKGQTRALKEYGVDLDNTEDLLLAQAEAMDKVIDRSKGIVIAHRDMRDQLDALNNDWDTAIGLSYDWLGSLEQLPGPLGWFAENLAETNTVMAETDGLILDVITSYDVLAETAMYLLLPLQGIRDGFAGITDAVKETTQAMLIQKTVQQSVEWWGKQDFVGVPSGAGEMTPSVFTGQESGGGKPLRKKGGGGRGAPGLQEYLNQLNEAALLEQEIARLRSGFMIGEGLGESQLGIGSMEFTGAGVLEAEAEFQAMINQELRERVDLELDLNEAKSERMGLLSQLSQIDPDHMTLEEKHELWDLEREQMEERRIYEEERLEYLAEELSFAEQFGEAWTNALDRVTVGESAALATMTLLHGTTEMFLAKLIKGSPLSAKAFAKLVAALAFKESVYWAAQALAKEGVAIYNFASPYGDKSEGAAAQAAAGQYAAAAAMFGTISAAMGAAGRGGGGGGGGKSAGAGGGYGGGGYGGGWQGGQAPQVSVEFKVEGSIQHLWDTLVEGVTIRVSDQQRTGSYNHYPGAR